MKMELYESKVEPSSLRFAAPRSPAVFAALPSSHCFAETSRRAKESRVQRRRTGDCGLRTGNCESAFTIIELLVVISILGIMAALTVPVLKNFAKSDATLGASRQLLDGVARARQLAISQRTTVYMVFVPTNFWNDTSGQWPNNNWWNNLTLAQRTVATNNLCDKQLTGYTFVSLRSVGDQPGQGVPHYLAPWQTLPDNTFIAAQKFYTTNTIVDQISGATYPISEFNYTNKFPFPTETAFISGTLYLPYIAFNYLGQLTVDGADLAGQDEYIPIAKGSVLFARDSFTKAFQFNPPDVAETPPGNSINSYNIVHIDRLTGRAVLEYQKVK
jgi:prepilin-type N-terminal cleavage/methylation domain-containing protein